MSDTRQITVRRVERVSREVFVTIDVPVDAEIDVTDVDFDPWEHNAVEEDDQILHWHEVEPWELIS